MDGKRSNTLKNIKTLKYSLIIGYAVIVVTAILGVSALAINVTDKALRNKVSSLVSSLNVQMKLNMNSYIDRMETIATLAFAAEETYKYDATNPDNDEYEAINTEKAISDKLFSLCIMDNLLDYGIVYRNNHTVGKMSNGTITTFGESIYMEMESVITESRTQDGWAVGLYDNFNRIYYVKRVNENALLVMSFYTAELEKVFDNPETLRDMSIRLVNSDYHIIYSTKDADEIGELLPADLLSRVRAHNAATVLDDDYLTTISPCGDDWLVVCSIPSDIILEEKGRIRMIVLIAAVIAAIAAAILGMVLSLRLTKPVEEILSALDDKAHTDQLTGILNKLSFEEYTKHRLQSEIRTVPHALILIDVDNFKGVNDTLGHAYGDQVLATIGANLRSIFSTNDFCGRIGGDEFCVLLNTPPGKDEDYLDFTRSKCRAICEAFHSHYTGDDGTYKISASIGCAIFPENGDDFESLYKMADKALYESKHRGKDTFTIAASGEVTDHA